MESVVKARPDVRLRIVDISPRGAAAAQQHGIRAVPTLWLYSDGVQVASDTQGTVRALAELE